MIPQRWMSSVSSLADKSHLLSDLPSLPPLQFAFLKQNLPSPPSHRTEQVVAVVSCMFVVVSTLCLIFSTLPRFQQKDANGIIRKFSLHLHSCNHHISIIILNALSHRHNPLVATVTTSMRDVQKQHCLI